jgi:hypothetical protein
MCEEWCCWVKAVTQIMSHVFGIRWLVCCGHSRNRVCDRDLVTCTRCCSQ